MATIRLSIDDLFAAVLRGDTTYRCPVAGCRVSVRFRGVSEKEARDLATYAVDHSSHRK
jgi:hypothetical protein